MTVVTVVIILFCHSMQLAVDVQIPEIFGGMDGEAVYIGTYIGQLAAYIDFSPSLQYVWILCSISPWGKRRHLLVGCMAKQCYIRYP